MFRPFTLLITTAALGDIAGDPTALMSYDIWSQDEDGFFSATVSSAVYTEPEQQEVIGLPEGALLVTVTIENDWESTLPIEDLDCRRGGRSRLVRAHAAGHAEHALGGRDQAVHGHRHRPASCQGEGPREALSTHRAGTPATLHRKAPSTGGTGGWPVPAPPVPEEGLYLTAPAPWVPELRLYLYRWYGESL